MHLWSTLKKKRICNCFLSLLFDAVLLSVWACICCGSDCVAILRVLSFVLMCAGVCVIVFAPACLCHLGFRACDCDCSCSGACACSSALALPFLSLCLLVFACLCMLPRCLCRCSRACDCACSRACTCFFSCAFLRIRDFLFAHIFCACALACVLLFMCQCDCVRLFELGSRWLRRNVQFLLFGHASVCFFLLRPLRRRTPALSGWRDSTTTTWTQSCTRAISENYQHKYIRCSWQPRWGRTAPFHVSLSNFLQKASGSVARKKKHIKNRTLEQARGAAPLRAIHSARLTCPPRWHNFSLILWSSDSSLMLDIFQYSSGSSRDRRS